MTEHYTRNTIEASAWCGKCKKNTMHRVDRDEMQGRLGPCLVCMAKHDAEHAVIDIDELRRKLRGEEQGELFCV